MMMIRIARLSVYFIQLVSLTSRLRGNREGRLSAILIREAQINKSIIVYITDVDLILWKTDDGSL